MGKPPQPRKQQSQAVPIVGIGASAGGLEAFTTLLKGLAPDTGMAFVLISHLMHEQKSFLGELLSRATPMPVSQLEVRTRMRPNHVYVIPPDKELSIEHGYLKTRPLLAAERPSMVIDRFFRSLAQDRKSKAIGVILSGTGSDGTSGLAAIKAEGGITFVQDPESAAYGDMPCNAEASADYVLSPTGIANELKRIAEHPYVSSEPAPGEQAPQVNGELKQIFALIRAAGGVNFAHYKPASIRRRIARRMVLKKTESLQDYLKHLRTNKEEVDALYEDLLITVTEFFRDPEVFEVLKSNVIPQILSSLSNDTPARVWVPGCASGEEAYSIAMCFVEASKDRGGSPVQIFATDVSEDCIAKARRGLYPENITASMSRERLGRFFVKEGGLYRVSKFIRDLCIFAQQDVIDDAPFSRIDLVSCRNLLIYLDTPTQKEVLHRFHYALRPTGFLLLGASESIAAAPQLFEHIHKSQRIYSKLPVTSRVDFALGANPAGHGLIAKGQATRPPLLDVRKEIDELLLRRFAPCGVLLNSAMEILEFRGPTSFVIEPTSGEASLNIFKMIRKELAVELRVALHEARVSSTPVRKEELKIQINGEPAKLNLDVMRFRPEPKGPDYYLVLFEHVPGPVRPQHSKRKDKPQERVIPGDRRALKLEQELKAVREHLRSIIEEQESTNEELQSANEEILASNEELQSMNEETQTAREELQATNEELHSVNDELQRRNADLGDAYADLTDLAVSLDIANVLVDNDRRIRRFTPAAQKLFNLIPADLGRPIADIKPNINVSDLSELIQQVIAKISVVEREVQDSQGRWYSMRIRPYKTAAMKVEGAVMLLVDIDNLKRAEAALNESNQKWQKLVDEMPDFILNPAGQILFVNSSLVSLAHGAEVGTSIYEGMDVNDRAVLKASLEDVGRTGHASAFQTRPTGGLQQRTLETVISPIKNNGNLIAMTMVTKQLQTFANSEVIPLQQSLG